MTEKSQEQLDARSKRLFETRRARGEYIVRKIGKHTAGAEVIELKDYPRGKVTPIESKRTNQQKLVKEAEDLRVMAAEDEPIESKDPKIVVEKSISIVLKLLRDAGYSTDAEAILLECIASFEKGKSRSEFDLKKLALEILYELHPVLHGLLYDDISEESSRVD